MEAEVLLHCLKICLLCVLWYSMSAANGIIGKTVLSAFPYPVTITIVQLASTYAWSIPMFYWFRVPEKNTSAAAGERRSAAGSGYFMKVILPLAFGKFLASASGHVSIWKVPVSYAHTVKATMPLFAVALSRCVLGERYSCKTYASLVPIIVGVLIATVTELQFDLMGLLAALVSTGIFALQNVYSKKCLLETDMHQLRLLFVLSKYALLFAIPCWLVLDVRRFVGLALSSGTILDTQESVSAPSAIWIAALLALDGFCNFAQNCVAFTMIALVSPLSYSVANCCKRVAVIGASLLVLRNPITWLNLLGMGVTLVGVFAYNQAQLERKRAPKRAQATPLLGVAVDMHSHSFLEVGMAAKLDMSSETLNGVLVAGANGDADNRRFGSRVEHDVVNRRVLIHDV